MASQTVLKFEQWYVTMDNYRAVHRISTTEERKELLEQCMKLFYGVEGWTNDNRESEQPGLPGLEVDQAKPSQDAP